MSDYIKREDAIEQIQAWCVDISHPTHLIRDDAVYILEHLPSADVVERKTGKWIHNPNGIDRDFIWWKCSECGQVIYSETEKDRREFHAFCGRCGADMRERSENDE